jgi:hypothetical protein
MVKQKTPIHIISAVFFDLNRGKNGKCNCSSEDHHKVQKPIEILI